MNKIKEIDLDKCSQSLTICLLVFKHFFLGSGTSKLKNSTWQLLTFGFVYIFLIYFLVLAEPSRGELIAEIADRLLPLEPIQSYFPVRPGRGFCLITSLWMFSLFSPSCQPALHVVTMYKDILASRWHTAGGWGARLLHLGKPQDVDTVPCLWAHAP